MLAACELVSAAAHDSFPILRDFLPAVMQRMQAALQMQCMSNDDKENKEQLLGLLVELVLSLYQRLEKEMVLPSTDQCMDLLLQTARVPNSSCIEDVLPAVGAVAAAVDEDFTVSANESLCVCFYQ
jgi:hypothetical protein